MSDQTTEEKSARGVVAKGLHHHGFSVSDIDRSVRFYEQAFGAETEWIVEFGGEGAAKATGVLGADMRVASLRFAHGWLEIFEYRHPEGRAYDRAPQDIGTSHLCLEVDDIEAAYEWLLKLGIPCRYPPQHVYEGPRAGLSFFYLEDPDGLPVELLQYHKQ